MRFQRAGDRSMIALGLLLACAPTLAAAAPTSGAEPTSRFHSSGKLTSRAISDDRRFTLEAEIRSAPAADSSDGRFLLKQVRTPSVGCDPLGPNLFADGFES